MSVLGRRVPSRCTLRQASPYAYNLINIHNQIGFAKMIVVVSFLVFSYKGCLMPPSFTEATGCNMLQETSQLVRTL
jgi:hypothetical protein